MPRNPYLNRSMIRAVDQFFGRGREVGRIMARIGASSPQSVSVVGERRVGKSSLLWHLSQEEVYSRYLDEPDRYLFLLLDFQGQQRLDEGGFCRIFGHQLQATAGARLEVPSLRDFAGLEELAQSLDQAGLRLVCLFDEFESITRNPAFGAEFFGLLRSLANARPVAFITSSRLELQGLCHTRQIADSPFFNIFAQVKLGPLAAAEARELIAAPSAGAGIPLEPYGEEILSLGGYLPFFLQLACSAAFECLAEGDPQRLDHEAVEQRFAQEALSHFRYLWEHFTPEQREVMGCLAGGVAPPPERALALRSLTAEGYAEQGRLFSRAFGQFLRENAPQAIPPPQPIPAPQFHRPRESLVAPLPEGASPFPQLIGQSEAIRQVAALMQKAIAADCTVLLTGETGTGKELVARILHQHSRRREAPFVPVNCGAIAEHLQESELFGHKRGAFTDALADREGLFEAAQGGTLFLDEISETSPATQVKLLRALQEGEIRRVGENETRKVEVRLICATNRELEEEVAQGRFREDLYYRLYVLVLRLPPLRDRRADIPLLVGHFLAGYEGGVSPEAMEVLEHYAWPGNIRELENQLASARALAGGERLEPAHLWPRVHRRAAVAVDLSFGEGLGLKEAREEFERRFILARLEQCGGDLEETSRRLGLSRSRLYELIRRLGLKGG
jgi:transcriptional regulator with AAA-type ATPase domain